MRADIVFEYSSDLSLSASRSEGSEGVVEVEVEVEVEVDDDDADADVDDGDNDEGGTGDIVARRDAFAEPRRCTKEGLEPPAGALTRCILCGVIQAPEIGARKRPPSWKARGEGDESWNRNFR